MPRTLPSGMLTLLTTDDCASAIAGMLWPRIADSESCPYGSLDDLAAAIAALIAQVRDDLTDAEAAYAHWYRDIPISDLLIVECQIERIRNVWRYAVYLNDIRGPLTLRSRLAAWQEKPFDA